MKVNKMKNLATVEYSCCNCGGRIDKDEKDIGWVPFADGVEVGMCGACNRMQEQERAEMEEEAARDAAEEKELCNSMAQKMNGLMCGMRMRIVSMRMRNMIRFAEREYFANWGILISPFPFGKGSPTLE